MLQLKKELRSGVISSLPDESSLEEKLKKHRFVLYALGVSFIIAGVAFFGYITHHNSQEKKAQEEMVQAVFALEDKKYKDAIEGTEDYLGLREIAKKNKKTAAYTLAKYYLGVAYMRVGNFDGAIEAFGGIVFKDLVMQSMVYSLVGDCFMEKENFDSAVLFYKKAIEETKSSRIKPLLMVKVARAFEARGVIGQALDVYKDISRDYPDFDVSEVRKQVARLSSSME